MKIPILTYQSMNIHGSAYAQSDLVALASDLETVVASGFRIRPLHQVVEAWLRTPEALAGERIVAITCDQGTDLDFHDLAPPGMGTQRSVFNILRDFGKRHPGSGPNATSFVIVGPEARRELDKACMDGRGWWNHAWWREAAASGLLHIANQSWDYNHAALPDFFSHGVPLGTFRAIATRALADAEIARAAEYLRMHAPNPGDTLFAYPYGETNDYLLGEYFPQFGARLGIAAAFTREPAYFTADAARWRIPRFVFGRDWKSPAELERILAGAAS